MPKPGLTFCLRAVAVAAGIVGTATLCGCEGRQPVAAARATDVVEARSGSRLKARFYQAESGVQTFHEFFDSKLGIACWFRATGDQEYRCLPGDANVSTRDFADAACKAPVVLVPKPACDKPAYVFRWQDTPDHCGSWGHVYQVGDRIDRTYSNESFITAGASCSKDSYPVLPGDQAYALGPEVPLDGFVRAQRMAGEAATGPLVASILMAEDGALEPAGWEDAAGSRCNLVRASDDTLRCVPEPAQSPSTSTFSDAACTMPALVAWAGCPAPHYGYRYAGCPLRQEIVSVGDPLTSLFSRPRGMCGAQAASSAGAYWATGAVVPPSSFAALAESVGEEGTHVKRRFNAGPSGVKVDGGLFDMTRAEACRPTTTDGTEWRCAPLASSGSNYSDPACTQPVWGQLTAGCMAGGTVYVEADPVTCPARRVYYRKGDPWSGPTYHIVTSWSMGGPAGATRTQSCRPTTTTDISYFALTPIPDAELPRLDIVER
jgi:hypothetical protein